MVPADGGCPNPDQRLEIRLQRNQAAFLARKLDAERVCSPTERSPKGRMKPGPETGGGPTIERQRRKSGPTKGGFTSTVKAFASKSPEQAARIAGVLTLFEDAGAGHVSERQMANGIELAQFYLSEAHRLANAAISPPEIRDASACGSGCWRPGTSRSSAPAPSFAGPQRAPERQSGEEARRHSRGAWLAGQDR